MIVVVGLSHKTAPIEVRERLAIPKADLPQLLNSLLLKPHVGEAMLVSTCNRVEVIAACKNGASDLGAVAEECSAALSTIAPHIQPHLYRHIGGAAVRHLFRVASSLDSLVLGEPQILGQVKDAYEFARQNGAIGSVLHRTLPRALRAAKRVRNETAIGTGQVSVPSVAVDLARQILGNLAGVAVLLVGSGEMAEAVARLLAALGASISVVGRTPEHVQELARAVGGTPYTWDHLVTAISQASVIVTSTSAPGFVIDFEQARAAQRTRRGKTQFYIDLAVPRDVDPKAAELDGVFLYNVDDFSRIVAESLLERSKEANQAELIIATEAEGYDRWVDAEQATPLIVAMRARFREALEEELRRSLRGRLKHLKEEDRAALEKMQEAVLNRLLHTPSIKLRQAALDRQSLEQMSQAITLLFGLDLSAPHSDIPALSSAVSDPPSENAAAESDRSFAETDSATFAHALRARSS